MNTKFYYKEDELDINNMQVSWVDCFGETHFENLRDINITLHSK